MPHQHQPNRQRTAKRSVLHRLRSGRCQRMSDQNFTASRGRLSTKKHQKGLLISKRFLKFFAIKDSSIAPRKFYVNTNSKASKITKQLWSWFWTQKIIFSKKYWRIGLEARCYLCSKETCCEKRASNLSKKNFSTLMKSWFCKRKKNSISQKFWLTGEIHSLQRRSLQSNLFIRVKMKTLRYWSRDFFPKK